MEIKKSEQFLGLSSWSAHLEPYKRVDLGPPRHRSSFSEILALQTIFPFPNLSSTMCIVFASWRRVCLQRTTDHHSLTSGKKSCRDPIHQKHREEYPSGISYFRTNRSLIQESPINSLLKRPGIETPENVENVDDYGELHCLTQTQLLVLLDISTISHFG
ncbi:hypothetical protein QR680_013651 [Steinernema hermaphroditum]|uniref:Uncharacterized protein n=1 Tax=Steinernema hermaphroditum TaxID=289476 RepID=A0AA39I8T5_9BILA|nr:hypothetical protein QR680_013651 [Steinernema hermaphroditum]